MKKIFLPLATLAMLISCSEWKDDIYKIEEPEQQENQPGEDQDQPTSASPGRFTAWFFDSFHCPSSSSKSIRSNSSSPSAREIKS